MSNKRQNFIKHFFIYLFFMFFITSCDNQKKLISYFKPVKEVSFNMKNNEITRDISFLFIIDYSMSMDIVFDKLARNIQLFLDPFFSNYPDYNYNFAITSMMQRPQKQLIFVYKDINCKGLTPSLFSHNTNIGPFLRFSLKDLQNKNINRKSLVCLLSNNISEKKGVDEKEKKPSNEFSFNSLTFIIENADSNFKSHFFGKDNFLILFFITDSWGENNIEYKNLLFQKQQRAAEIFSQQPFLLLDSVMGGMNKTFSYGLVQDNKSEDSCASMESTGENPKHYPFHLYRFIEKTGGSIISICDKKWENKLINVFDDLKVVFSSPFLELNEVPKLDTIEVFLNNKKIPKDTKQGWSFNPENLSIYIGPEFNYLAYTANKKDKKEEDVFTIKYIPVNIEILAD